MAGADPSPRSFVRSRVALIGHCFAEARPVVQIVFLLRFLVGALFVEAGGGGSLAGVVLGAVAMTCAVMAVYLLNGVMDIVEDRANGSRRPVARGALSAGAATKAIWLFAALALLTGSLIPAVLWCVGLSLLLGFAYSAPPLEAKRRTVTSAAVVIGLGFTSYLAGTVAAGGDMPATGLLFCGVLALWMGLVGAVTKDLSDIPGDKAAGRRTIAVLHGERSARVFASVCALALGATGLAIALVDDHTILVGAAALALGAGWVAVRCLRPSPARARAPYRAFMVTQYAANVGLAVALLAATMSAG